jgi:hypothetical protein
MRYKESYRPSQLRCTERGSWHALDAACMKLLDANKYVALSAHTPALAPPNPHPLEKQKEPATDAKTGTPSAATTASSSSSSSSAATSTASAAPAHAAGSAATPPVPLDLKEFDSSRRRDALARLLDVKLVVEHVPVLYRVCGPLSFCLAASELTACGLFAEPESVHPQANRCGGDGVSDAGLTRNLQPSRPSIRLTNKWRTQDISSAEGLFVL